ncbi:MAG: PAS domain-containing protein [Salinivirgaceae bacterium]|jgi:PAS domain-containing protein
MGNEEIDFSNADMLRRKAEEKLLEKKNIADYDIEEADVTRLLHELQVHQIEFEMQNEELRMAYEIAEKALQKYTMLYDLAPMGYFTLNLEGIILDLNFTGAQILGGRRFSLLKSNFKLFVADESKQEFNQFFSKIFSSNSKETCEVRLNCDRKLTCLVYIEGIISSENEQCLLSIVDISRFKK